MSEVIEEPTISDGDDGRDIVEDILVVTIPSGATSGDRIMLDIEGKTVEFIIPPGSKAGDDIEVRPDQLIERGEGESSQSNDVNNATMLITVPRGSSSGNIVTIDYNGKTIDFIIPIGYKEGDEIEVTQDELDQCNVSEPDNELPLESVQNAKEEIKGEQSSPEKDTRDGDVEYATVDISVPHDIPSGELLTFEAPDGRRFSVPILEGVSVGDVLTIQLPDTVASGDDEYLAVKMPEEINQSDSIVPDDSPVNKVEETIEEVEDKIIKTTIEEREDGTKVTTIETTTTLKDGNRSVETETMVEKPVKHKTLREKRQQMLEWKKQMEEKEPPKEDVTSTTSIPQRKPKPKPTSEVVDEATAKSMYSSADEFYNAGEVRAGGRYAYNYGMQTNEECEKEGDEDIINPYMPEVKPTLPADYYQSKPEPKEIIDVEASRRGAMSRSAAITQFEEDRAAVFDENGNEKPSPFQIIALEAAAIVNTRRAEGGNANLNALVAKDEQRIKARVLG